MHKPKNKMMTSLLIKFPGTKFIITFMENCNNTKNYFDLSSLENNRDIIYDYCVGLKDYQSTLISLEKELVYSQLYEHNNELNTLSLANCDYLCAFCNNVEYIRNTILLDCVFDDKPLPTEANCQMVRQLRDVHYYTFDYIRNRYMYNIATIQTIFNQHESYYLHYLLLITNENENLNSSRLKEASRYLWEAHRDFFLDEAISSPLTHYILEAYMKAKRIFLKENNTKWVHFEHKKPILPASFLHIQYPCRPIFQFVQLDSSLAAYLDKTRAQINRKLNSEFK